MKPWSVLLLVAVIAMGGCQSMPWQKKSTDPTLDANEPAAKSSTAYESPAVEQPGLALSSEQRFSDVPLPVGVKEIAKESYVYESSNVQIGRMVYKSRASVDELAQFYIDQAPAGQWKFQNIVQADDGADLTFVKPGRTLTVSVKNLGVVQGRRLILNSAPANQ